MNKLAVAAAVLGLAASLNSGAQQPQRFTSYNAQERTLANGIGIAMLDAAYREPARDSRIQVLAIFSFGNGFSYLMESRLNAWIASKPDNVDIIRVHAADHPADRVLARFYYTLCALGRTDLDSAVFDAIFKESSPLDVSNEDISFPAQLHFAKEHGIGLEEFSRIYRSTAVSEMLRKSRELRHQYDIDRLPTFVVDGRYRLSMSEPAREEEAISAVQLLVKTAAAR